jgi:hypothetical protein
MQSIFDLKEQAVTDTPLLVFDCVLADGRTEHWSTHAVTVGGVDYDARVSSHNVFELQAASSQGVDGIPRISLALANADSHFSQIERQTGWKGARLTASFLFYDLRNATALTDAAALFQGICNPPDEIREAGAGFWPLRVFREIDHALLHLLEYGCVDRNAAIEKPDAATNHCSTVI